MAEKEQTIRLYIESPDGERFECEVLLTTVLYKLAVFFATHKGWPAVDEEGYEQRFAVELVDLERLDYNKRLNADLTIGDAGLCNGDILRVFPEAIGGEGEWNWESIIQHDWTIGSYQINVHGGQVGVIGNNAHVEGGISFVDKSPKNSTVRYSDVSFPAHAEIRCPAALRVAVTLNPTSKDAVPLDLQVPPDFTMLEVDVCLVSSPVDFDLEGPNVQTIQVPKDADSIPIIFKVIPKV